MPTTTLIGFRVAILLVSLTLLPFASPCRAADRSPASPITAVSVGRPAPMAEVSTSTFTEWCGNSPDRKYEQQAVVIAPGWSRYQTVIGEPSLDIRFKKSTSIKHIVVLVEPFLGSFKGLALSVRVDGHAMDLGEVGQGQWVKSKGRYDATGITLISPIPKRPSVMTTARTEFDRGPAYALDVTNLPMKPKAVSAQRDVEAATTWRELLRRPGLHHMEFSLVHAADQTSTVSPAILILINRDSIPSMRWKKVSCGMRCTWTEYDAETDTDFYFCRPSVRGK